jgi:opacity protein-like surface antigen
MTTGTITTRSLAGICACLLLAAPALAEDGKQSEGPDYGRDGFYLGANVIGASYINIGDRDQSPDADETAGFNIYGGYRFNEGIAFEVQGEWLAKSDVDVNNTSSDIETWAITGNVKYFILPDRFQPYLLMGMGGMHADFKDDFDAGLGGSDGDFIFRFGGGLDFYITEAIVASLGADYVLPAGSDLEDLDYVSYGAGIQYRF